MGKLEKNVWRYYFVFYLFIYCIFFRNSFEVSNNYLKFEINIEK